MKLNQNMFIKISEPVDENLCFVLMPFRPEIDEINELKPDNRLPE
jgi:hypothetical protein